MVWTFPSYAWSRIAEDFPNTSQQTAHTTFIHCSAFCLTCTAFLNLWCASPALSRLIYVEYHHINSVHAQLNRTAVIWYAKPLGRLCNTQHSSTLWHCTFPLPFIYIFLLFIVMITKRNCPSAVSIVSRLQEEQRKTYFHSRQHQEVFLFFQASRPILWPIQRRELFPLRYSHPLISI